MIILTLMIDPSIWRYFYVSDCLSSSVLTSSTLCAVLAEASMNIKPFSLANCSPSSVLTTLLCSRSDLFPTSIMVMFTLACCLASSNQLARWLNVSLLKDNMHYTIHSATLSIISKVHIILFTVASLLLKRQHNSIFWDIFERNYNNRLFVFSNEVIRLIHGFLKQMILTQNGSAKISIRYIAGCKLSFILRKCTSIA